MESSNIQIEFTQQEISKKKEELMKKIKEYVKFQLDHDLIYAIYNDYSDTVVKFFEQEYLVDAAKNGLADLALSIAAIKLYLLDLRNASYEVEVPYKNGLAYPNNLKNLSEMAESEEPEHSEYRKEFWTLIARYDALLAKAKNDFKDKQKTEMKEEKKERLHEPFILSDVNNDIEKFNAAVGSLYRVYNMHLPKGLDRPTTDLLNKRKKRQHSDVERIFFSYTKEDIENLMQAMENLVNGKQRILQVMAASDTKHQFLFDMRYNKENNLLQIICFDSATDIAQAELLDYVVRMCKSNFEAKGIGFFVIACQAEMQKDPFSCGVYTHIIANKLLKEPNIFDELNKAPAIHQPTFGTKTSVVVYKNAVSDHETIIQNTKWVALSAFPDKIILTAQSFSIAEDALKEKYTNLYQKDYPNDEEGLNQAVKKTVVKIISDFKQKHGFDKLNVYIPQKRVNLAIHLTQLDKIFIEQQDIQQIQPDVKMLKDFLINQAHILRNQTSDKDNAVKKAERMENLVKDIEECKSLTDLRKITMAIIDVASIQTKEAYKKLPKFITPTPKSLEDLQKQLKGSELLQDVEKTKLSKQEKR